MNTACRIVPAFRTCDEAVDFASDLVTYLIPYRCLHGCWHWGNRLGGQPYDLGGAL